MHPCKHLDYTDGRYTDCTIQEIGGFAVPVRFRRLAQPLSTPESPAVAEDASTSKGITHAW
jgi:hypothetical protein